MNNVILSKGLGEDSLSQIKGLDEICGRSEPLHMKLNWEMLETRPENEVNDLLWYENGQLAGFLGLYGFGTVPEELELTGMVHPDFRRRGIFSRLFAEAVTISRARGAKRLLLISERQSSSGAGFAGNAGLTYDFSEYRMICQTPTKAALTPHAFTLRPAEETDKTFLIALDESCFGNTFGDCYERELGHLYVAEADGSAIGKIGLEYEKGMGYVFGVAVRPEQRGRGYGRAMLTTVLKKHFDTRDTPVILEVAVKNENALSLYKSCGFEMLTVYDYYALTL